MAGQCCGCGDLGGRANDAQGPMNLCDIIRYQQGVQMPNVLIRDIPQEDLELLDEQARRAGLSRADFLRRQLQQQARRSATPVVVEDLEVMTQLLQGLGEDDVIADAWS